MVDFDGHPVRVMTAGFEHLERGQPVVVFESGGGGTGIGNWGSVFTDVAKFAPVVAYERGGVGESEWDGEPPTPERVTVRLHALLSELDAPPPYVLVGHSRGGPLIRMFAGRYPDEVVGLVYVDPTDFTQSRADGLALLSEIGIDESTWAAMDEVFRDISQQAEDPPGISAENEAIDSFLRMEPEERGLLPAPEVPLAVLLSGRYDGGPPLPPGVEFPFEFRDYHEVHIRQRVRNMSAWALEAPEGFFVLATNAGHNVHQDDPALVVDAIRRIVFPDAARQLREALATGGDEALVETHRSLVRRYPAEQFEESFLNALGYEALREERVDHAISLFELNVEVYPDAPNPYDSLGDAYSAVGRLEEARASYARAVDLAERQAHPNLETYRENLERVSALLDGPGE